MSEPSVSTTKGDLVSCSTKINVILHLLPSETPFASRPNNDQYFLNPKELSLKERTLRRLTHTCSTLGESQWDTFDPELLVHVYDCEIYRVNETELGPQITEGGRRYTDRLSEQSAFVSFQSLGSVRTVSVRGAKPFLKTPNICLDIKTGVTLK